MKAFAIIGIILALEAILFLYVRLRTWKRIVVARNSIRFPKLCPCCLFSEPSVEVFESSSSRKVSFRKSEFLHLNVPYCRSCGETITKHRQISRWTAFALAVVGFGILYACSAVDVNDYRDLFAIFIGLFFAIGWPIHELWGNRKRSLVLKRYNDQVLVIKIKSPIYHEALRQMNT